MSSPDALSLHLHLCDDLHLLALEENRFIKESQRAPEPALVERRRVLLERLDESLLKLKETGTADVPADRALREKRREVVEKSRSRILQILHLQKENEQLVLRYSLGGPKPASPLAAVAAGQLQKMYERHR